jgi:serine/threonine-protein kinase
MDSARYEQVQNLFHDALERPEPERREFVETLSKDDPDLALAVMAMLEADGENVPLLDRGLPDLAHEFLESPPTSLSEGEFGSYRLKKLLGEGGMGVVWLAERKDANNLVAIKFLPHAGLSPSRRERFTREIKTLARLKHRLIARLYDAGALADGTPWFVMEYVEGVPFTDYCRSHQLPIRHHLRLLRQVCEAVHYAHAQEVIHRDLKPSNILVEADGTPRLLDFGIAKQLQATDEPGDWTRAGLRFYSPDYAAPEWIRDGVANFHTDVYSVGVMLYESITGQLPFDRSAHVAEKEPRKPSTLSPRAGLSKNEWSDLDILCLKALQTDPQQRYQSVEAMGRDLDHFLKSEPLEARPGSIGYRLGKFAVRHRPAVISATLGFAFVIALVGFFTIRLAKERNTAQEEAARTRRVEAFTLNLFQGGEEDAGPAENLKVVDLLDRGVREARELGSDPLVQIDVYRTLGDVYQNLAEYDRADSVLQSALAKSRAAFGPNHPAVAKVLAGLGLLRNEQGRLAEAEELLRNALTIDRRSLPTNHPDLADVMNGLGLVLGRRGKYDEAIGRLSDAVRLQSSPTGDKRILSYSLFYLANAHYYLGHYAMAESLNLQLMEDDRKLHGDHHPDVAVELMNLANIRNQLGDLAESERRYREAFKIFKDWYGESHPTTADAMAYVGRTLVYEGKYDEAGLLLQRALDIEKAAYGRTPNPRLAFALGGLGAIALAKGQLNAAEKDYQEALAIDRAAYGEQHQFTAATLSNLGEVYLERGQYIRAEGIFREAIKRLSAKQGSDPAYRGAAQVKLGRSLMRQRRYPEAETETMAGYAILNRATGPGVDWLRKAEEDLVTISDALKKPEQAARFRDALAANRSKSAVP